MVIVKVSFVLLAHEKPEQLKDLIGSLLGAGSNIYVHHDATASGDLPIAVADWGYEQLPGKIYYARRLKVVWGEWSIVQATLNCIEEIKKHDVDSDYFMLISGSCMPVKPVHLLEQYLTESGKDHIEAVNAEKYTWVTAGLQKQRWSKYHFFNWRYQKFLFDTSLKIQRKLKIKRILPLKHTAYMGSQWWCLRRSTLLKVHDLYHSKPTLRKFYRRTWVPDELFFQTMVANIINEEQICGDLVTRYIFNSWGVPRIFYNDDYPELLGEKRFFVRKVSHRAVALRKNLAAIGPMQIEEFAELLEHSESERQQLQELAKMKQQIVFNRWHSLVSSFDSPYDYIKSIPNPMMVLIGSDQNAKFEALKALDQLSNSVVYGDLFDKNEVGHGYPNREGLSSGPSDVALMHHNWHLHLGDIAFRNPGKLLVFSLSDEALKYLTVLRWNADCHVIMIDRKSAYPIDESLMSGLYIKSKMLHLLQDRQCELSRLSVPVINEFVGRLSKDNWSTRSFTRLLKYYQTKVRWPGLLTDTYDHWDFLKSIYSKILVFVYEQPHTLEGVQELLSKNIGVDLYEKIFSAIAADDESLDWHYYLADLAHLNARLTAGVLAIAVNKKNIKHLDTLRWKRNLLVIALEDENAYLKSDPVFKFGLYGSKPTKTPVTGQVFRELDVMMRDRHCSYTAISPYEQHCIEEEIYSFLHFCPIKGKAPTIFS